MQNWLGIFLSIIFHALLFRIPLEVLAPREPPLPELQLVLVSESCTVGGGAPVQTAAAPEPPPEEPEKPDEPEVEPEPVEPPQEPVLTPKPPPVVKPPKPKPVPKKKPVTPHPPVEDKPQAVDPAPAPGPPQEGLADSHVAKAGPSGPQGPVEASFGAGDGPRFVQKAMPRYPRLARELGKEGTVLLRLTIDERGSLTHVEVLRRAGSGFDEEAVRAARESKFSPARMNGRAVACRAQLPVRFVLRSNEND
jgi:protein TonB